MPLVGFCGLSAESGKEHLSLRDSRLVAASYAPQEKQRNQAYRVQT
jgi:hypothetical protein